MTHFASITRRPFVKSTVENQACPHAGARRQENHAGTAATGPKMPLR